MTPRVTQAEIDAALLRVLRGGLIFQSDREFHAGFILRLAAERDLLHAAIVSHRANNADDRCIEDDDRLYDAAGLPPCDRRVGLANVGGGKTS